MIFQVVGIDKRVKMSTKFVSCIPDDDTLKSMQEAGYSFRLDGKQYRIKDRALLKQYKDPPIPENKEPKYEIVKHTPMNLLPKIDIPATKAPQEVVPRTLKEKALEAVRVAHISLNTRTIYCVEIDKAFSTQQYAAKECGLYDDYMKGAIKIGVTYKGNTFLKVMQIE